VQDSYRPTSTHPKPRPKPKPKPKPRPKPTLTKLKERKERKESNFGLNQTNPQGQSKISSNHMTQPNNHWNCLLSLHLSIFFSSLFLSFYFRSLFFYSNALCNLFSASTPNKKLKFSSPLCNLNLNHGVFRSISPLITVIIYDLIPFATAPMMILMFDYYRWMFFFPCYWKFWCCIEIPCYIYIDEFLSWIC
jgi:hypothetical protein